MQHHLLTLKANIRNLNHPLAHLNTFNLGYMEDNPHITLIQPLHYNNPKMTLYPHAPSHCHGLQLSAHEHHPQSRQDLPGQGAEMVSTFKGKNTARLCGNKKQVILDLFNALGWNTGHLKTTAFNSANASWLVLPRTSSQQTLS
ncbi:hypothetical protein NDA16_003042 [Ustilago loliicola]|nr:hypothetical protein NDA16_003042 [Ustilago loliicola]